MALPTSSAGSAYYWRTLPAGWQISSGDLAEILRAGGRINPVYASYDLLEIVEARCQRSMIFCTQYQSEGWYTRIDPNPDSGSPVSEAIMDRIIHNAYEVLVEGRVSMRERNGLKSARTEGSEEDI